MSFWTSLVCVGSKAFLGTDEYYQFVDWQDGDSTTYKTAWVSRPAISMKPQKLTQLPMETLTETPKFKDSLSVPLSEVTSHNAVYWVQRKEKSFNELRQANIRYEVNALFDQFNPQGYQFSRVQVDDGGVPLESTRQLCCLHCVDLHYFYLFGSEWLEHYERMHRHELPEFLVLLIDQLGLAHTPPPHQPQVHQIGTDECGFRCIWLELPYRDDWEFNQIRYAPHENGTKKSVKARNFLESHLVWYFHRDVGKLNQLQHGNVRYKLSPHFDCKNPELAQIYRFALDEQGVGVQESIQFLCLYCQEPQFFYLRQLLIHHSEYHGPLGLPGRKSVKQALALRCS